MGQSAGYRRGERPPTDHVTLTEKKLFVELVAGQAIAAYGGVAELVKSFDSSKFSKVLTTSATKSATMLDQFA